MSPLYDNYVFKDTLKESAFNYSKLKLSLIPLDVVFVTTEKDFEILPYPLESVKKYLKQPINKFILVSPKTEQAIKLSKSLGMEYIDENSLLDHTEFMNWVSQ